MKLNHLPKAREESQKFIKNDNKHFYRVEGNSYRFRNEPKQKFDEFRGKTY
jgi:uncharacterized protein (UPF0216 family)